MAEPIVDQQYWDAGYAGHKLAYSPEQIQFKEIFAQYLPRGGEGGVRSCFEVGCYPGSYLIYLGKEFGYEANGIDLTPRTAAEFAEYLRGNGVTVGKIERGDFFEFAPERQYDLVCSFGFVEHFADYEEVIRRHAALVKAGGTLVLSAPNFRGLQGVLHALLDKPNLDRHVLGSMNLRRWRGALERCGMQVVHEGYYRTFDFWTDHPTASRGSRWLAMRIAGAGRRVDRMVHWPNRFTSPYMISVARKEGPHE